MKKITHATAPRRNAYLTFEATLSLRRCVVAGVMVFVFALLAFSQATEPRGLAELKKGDYDNAFKLLSARLVSNPNDAVAQQALLRVYIETGRYAEAEATAKRFLQKTPDTGSVRHELAETLAITGRYTEAITEFEHAAADSAKADAIADKLESDLRRAEILDLTGQEDRARPIYESFVKHYTDNDPDTARELTLIARALAHLERYQDANDMYRSAIEADSDYLEAQLGAGELFTEKYAYGDAALFFDDGFKINPNSARAFLDLARNKRLDGDAETSAALAKALSINPNLVEALALKAAMALEASRLDDASTDIEKALKINPHSVEAHSLRAAMLYLQDKDFEPEVAATLAIGPKYGGVYNTLSHYATITRRTEQAVQFARRATEIAPRLWDAHLNLGMSLLRLGQMEPGREAVEKAFKGDPFNVWAKNTLDLLDSMRRFKETKTGAFIIKASVQESDVLAPYAAKLLEEAAAKLTSKYRFTPKGPVIIEIFQNHEDFAVRTLGIPGLGALGVCFGFVVAQDSPSAREAGEFNWGSTLWHEYTHVITLQMTDYRIPRWFSEGLSVYEERRARPGWGDDWNPLFVRAFMEKRWFRMADLDAGFQRPKSPQDVPIAYFQASQVCEFIVEKYGFDAILRMLALYREKARTPEVLQQVLKLTEADFDREFAAYIEAKVRPLQQALATQNNIAASLSKEEVLKMLATQDTFALRIRAAELLAADGDTEGAVAHYIRALELFPYASGAGTPFEALAKLLEQKGDRSQAAKVLEGLVKTDENNLEALKTIARLRLALGERQQALDALQASFYINPFDYKLHTQAGELSVELKDYAKALMEFQVALALAPPNVAEANYNVAAAYHALGRQPEAKRSVLRALEAAPRFEKAQELLLRIVGQ
ncbi:MAG TPA: tetratricopeptide repeat protein [Pyrinomonadaceae bacterium]|jgi:tetratricopeptide (TPR) repeat protein|nr:tetratricopeptide repeat protein [Pyrinomonadaceae bacterium]